jgi:iron complex transport system ATP-binding protein
MDATETRHLADRRYPTLSGGEQARVSFTRVLAQGAALLLLDEPTASLDLRHQEMVMEEIRARAAAGTAVVAVLHDINLAARFADRVVILDGGSVRAVGTPAEVLQEEVLASVYGIGVTVMRHPDGDHPLILPRGVFEDG